MILGKIRRPGPALCDDTNYKDLLQYSIHDSPLNRFVGKLIAKVKLNTHVQLSVYCSLLATYSITHLKVPVKFNFTKNYKGTLD